MRNKSVSAQGIYLGEGAKLCDTAGKELAKEVVKNKKGGNMSEVNTRAWAIACVLTVVECGK